MDCYLKVEKNKIIIAVSVKYFLATNTLNL